MKISSEELLEEAREIHRNKEDFIEGDLEERILKYSFYELVHLETSILDEEEWHTEDYLIEEYMEEETTPPPIIVSHEFSIIDGAHRLKIAKLKNYKTIRAYIGIKY